jgi:hypothetical protein
MRWTSPQHYGRLRAPRSRERPQPGRSQQGTSGTIDATPYRVTHLPRVPIVAVLVLTAATALVARAGDENTADHPIAQFLAQDAKQPSYLALRRLEAESGSRKGWLEATTEYSSAQGFRYHVTAEGGSDYIRHKVLRAVLDGERDVIARGEAARSLLAPANYRFQPDGLDREGLARVLLSPRRKERVLVAGTMFLNVTDGALIRVQGRLAKSPSFWIKDVDILRTYERIAGAVLPVTLDTTAQVRLFGPATLRMTYTYAEVDGRRVPSDE